MSNTAKRKHGWLPGSYYAATQLIGPPRTGAGARGAFDVPYNDGPASVPAKDPSQGKKPPGQNGNALPISNARKAAEALFEPAPAEPKPKPKPKHYKLAPFGVGDIIICSAREGNYRPCEDCRGIHFEVKLGHGQIPAKLRCQRCGRTSRELRKTHVV